MARRTHITGIVQGGYRPFVGHMAHRLGCGLALGQAWVAMQ